MRGVVVSAVVVALSGPVGFAQEGGDPNARPALPPVAELIPKLHTDRRDEAEVTIWQLVQHGAAAVEPLAEAVNDGSVKQRMRAAEALRGLRRVAAPAAPDLIKALKWDPPTGQEGGPGELTDLRIHAWRALAMYGGSPAVSLAKSEISKALRPAAVSEDAEVPGWIGAAVGCWLRQGGKSGESAVAKILLGALKWQGGAAPLIRALGEARDPGVVPALAALIDFEERDAQAMKLRNDAALAKAERAKRDPPDPEIAGPERMIAHEVLQQMTGERNATAGSWLVWWKDRRDWLYYSAKEGRLTVDADAKAAGKSTTDFRKDTAWPEGEGPDLPPYTPRFGGAIPRPAPGADEPGGEPGELPDGG